MVMNRKGVLRIAEASISILIILSFLVLVQVKNNSSEDVDFSERINEVLEEIAREQSLRQQVFDENGFDENGFMSDESELFTFIRQRIPESYLVIEARVCDEIDKICTLDRFIEGEVYAGQRVIVPSIEESEGFKARKLAIFVYRK